MATFNPSTALFKASRRQFYAVVVFNVLSILLYTAFFVVGVIHHLIKESECDRPLALYAIIFGTSSCISQVLSSLIPLLRGVADGKDKNRDKTVTIIGGVVGLFAFILFIVFNISTFSSVVCDSVLQRFCFWGITLVYIVVVGFVLASCCFLCFAFKRMSWGGLRD
ncbi:hypothetical protein RCL1_003373 [Eukaryota sp. TZLM3-RCL]